MTAINDRAYFGNDRAYFGIYADTQSLPNAHLLSTTIDESIEELFALS
jgi:hypothetical protein